MKLMQLFVLPLFLCLYFPTVFAQNSSPTASKTEQEKIQKELEKRALEMIDQAVSESQTLKLAQNRALVNAVAGDLYWKFDEKHARDLFRTAGGEILTANLESEKENKETDNPYAFFNDFENVRSIVLPLVAKHNADLALEMMTQTRSAKLAEAMIKATQPNAKQSAGMMSFDPSQYAVQNEIALEQKFAVLAAEQNPDKAVRLIKDSLAKGISYQVLPLLQKLNEKNEKKAQEVAEDVVKKIVDSDLTKKREDLGAAVNFLQNATNPNAANTTKEKQFKFSDAQLKSIADKVTDTLLVSANSMDNSMTTSRAMPSLEKFAPVKLSLLKQNKPKPRKICRPK